MKNEQQNDQNKKQEQDVKNPSSNNQKDQAQKNHLIFIEGVHLLWRR